VIVLSPCLQHDRQGEDLAESKMVCNPRNGFLSFTLSRTVCSIFTICLDKNQWHLCSPRRSARIILPSQQRRDMIFLELLDFVATQSATTVPADYSL
jgi:hypothetical protein